MQNTDFKVAVLSYAVPERRVNKQPSARAMPRSSVQILEKLGGRLPRCRKHTVQSDVDLELGASSFD